MQAVEIEVNGPHNEHLMFRPLQRSIRGSFDFAKIGEPMARVKANDWPPIPAQRLGIDASRTGYIIEPLHDAEHAPIREKNEKQGMSLEPELTEFEDVDALSWCFWMKRAVDSGLARVVSGSLPTDIDEKKVRRKFVLAEPEPSTTDKLTAAIEAQTRTFQNLIEAIAAKAK